MNFGEVRSALNAPDSDVKLIGVMEALDDMPQREMLDSGALAYAMRVLGDESLTPGKLARFFTDDIFFGGRPKRRPTLRAHALAEDLDALRAECPRPLALRCVLEGRPGMAPLRVAIGEVDLSELRALWVDVRGSFPDRAELAHELARLCDGECAPKLRGLRLPTWCEDGTIEALARAPGFARLRHLDVSGSDVSDDALEALCAASAPGQWRTLRLGHSEIMEAGVSELLYGAGGSDLRVLDLRECVLLSHYVLNTLMWSPCAELLVDVGFGGEDWSEAGGYEALVLGQLSSLGLSAP